MDTSSIPLGGKKMFNIFFLPLDFKKDACKRLLKQLAAFFKIKGKLILLVFLLLANTGYFFNSVKVSASEKVVYVAKEKEKEKEKDKERTGFFEGVGKFFKELIALLNPLDDKFILKQAIVPKPYDWKMLKARIDLFRGRMASKHNLRVSVKFVDLSIFGQRVEISYTGMAALRKLMFVLLGFYALHRFFTFGGGEEI